jgi:hypothetical protein
MPRPIANPNGSTIRTGNGLSGSASHVRFDAATWKVRRLTLPPHTGVSLHGAALSVLLVLASLAVQTRQTVAAQAVQTFGPGQVNCQAMTGTRVDCLLAATRVTAGNRNVATFGVTALPRGQQALFRKWCLSVANECTVTVTGRRASPQSSRLSTVTAVHWTRLSPPVNESAARVAAKASATEPTGRPAR